MQFLKIWARFPGIFWLSVGDTNLRTTEFFMRFQLGDSWPRSIERELFFAQGAQGGEDGIRNIDC